jgi:hypothetical protein
LSNEQAK